MKLSKKIKAIFLTALAVVSIFHTTVFASNLNLNVEFDGRKIEMTSETPKMEWNIQNLNPGESKEATLTINSIGTKEVKVVFNFELINVENIVEQLTIKIINNKTNEIIYQGKYLEFEFPEVKIPAKETNSYKIIIERLNNEGQGNINENKNFILKFNFTAKGEVTNNAKNTKELNNEKEQENITQTETKEISTNVISPIQKKEPYVIFVVFAILVLVFVILIILYCRIK